MTNSEFSTSSTIIGKVSDLSGGFSGQFISWLLSNLLSARSLLSKGASKMLLPGCAAPLYVSLRSEQQSLRYPGKDVVKPARLHFARTARALSEVSCPNFEPRAHARLTGLTTKMLRATGHARMVILG